MIEPFAIFYSDGSIVEGGGPDDEEVTLTFKVSRKWLEAPNDGVEAVIVKNPYNCRHSHSGKDHYYMLDGGEICNANDLGPYLRMQLKGMVKFGLNMDTEQYHEIVKKVKAYNKIPRDCDERKEKPKMD